MDLFKRIQDLSAVYDDDGPSATVLESRPMFNDGGMLVKPSADGSRPGYARVKTSKGNIGGSDYKPLTEDQTKLLKTRYADEIKKQGGYKKWRANPKNNWKVSYVRKGKITADTFKKTELDLDALEKIIDRTNLENKIYSQKEISDLYFKEKKIKPKGESRSVIRPSENKEIKNLFDKIILPEEKVNRVIEQMLISDEPLPEITFKSKDANAKANWRKYIINEVGEGAGDGLKNLLKNNKFYKKNAEVLNYMSNIRNDIEDMNFKDAIDYATKAKKGMPRLSGMKGNFSFSPVYRTMDFAFRNWDANKGKGLVKFFDKNGKPITWSPGLKKLDYNTVSFSKGDKQTFSVNGKYNNSISIRADGEQFFPKVFDAVKTRNALLDTMVDSPFKKGEQMLFSELITKIQIDGYGWSPDKKQVLEILHGPDGVAGNPFDSLKVGTSKLNNTLSTLDSIPIKGLKNKIMNQAYGQLKGLRGEKLTKAIIDQQLEIGEQVAAGKKFPITDRTQIFMDALNPEKEILGPLSQKEKTFVETKLKSPAVRLRNIETTEAIDNLLLKLSAQIDEDCAQAVANGGRIGLKTVGSSAFCKTKARNYMSEELTKGIGTQQNAKTSLIKRILAGSANFLKQNLSPKELFKMENLIGKPALYGAAAFETGLVADDVLRKGKPLNVAAAESLFGSVLNLDADAARAKNLLESNTQLSPAAKEYAQNILDYDKYRKLDLSFPSSLVAKSMPGSEKYFKMREDLKKKIESTPDTGAFDYQSALDESEGAFKAKPKFLDAPDAPNVTPLTNKFAQPPGRRVGPMTAKQDIKIDLTPLTYQNFKPDYGFTKEQFEDYMRKEGALADDQVYQDDFYRREVEKPIEFEQLMKLPSFRGASEKFAGGGIAKEAGDRSGAMTRSMNPDSQGLSYLFNRVKNT